MNFPTTSDPRALAQAGSQPEDAIRLENISVQYRSPQERIGTFKEYAIRWMQRRVEHQSFWALRDVSFSVRRGEVFGLIGQNGAGKSTLLKLIARVLRPSHGRVWVKGRVAPLLEVGAGFHPELTGRENVILNGAMLGFSRAEMDAKLPGIIEYAGLADFIDAPMRTYSSGMWARLGFAVATDADPDILIVDEILSVGDEAFQRKSAERMDSFRERGVTILLVSHNMSVIEELCQRAAWLDHGQLRALGPAASVVHQYLEQVREGESQRLAQQPTAEESHRWGSRKIEITRARLLNAQGAEQFIFHTGEKLVLEMEYIAHQPISSPIFGVAIHRSDGAHITGPNTGFSGLDLGLVQGRGVIRYCLPSLPLLEGSYFFSYASTDRDDTEMFDYHDRALPFQVDNHGHEVRERFGMLVLSGEWQAG